MRRTENHKLCIECVEGEHENYDDDVVLTRVYDVDEKSNAKLVRRASMCRTHRCKYDEDGYLIRTVA